jgi:hypothetical protein
MAWRLVHQQRTPGHSSFEEWPSLSSLCSKSLQPEILRLYGLRRWLKPSVPRAEAFQPLLLLHSFRHIGLMFLSPGVPLEGQNRFILTFTVIVMLGPLLVDLAMEFRTSVAATGQLAAATAATLVRYKVQG